MQSLIWPGDPEDGNCISFHVTVPLFVTGSVSHLLTTCNEGCLSVTDVDDEIFKVDDR